MRRGAFARAWAIGDRGLRRPPDPDRFTRPRHEQPIWDGRPLDGQRVLVRCYHGLGDTIQFARYLPMVAARARAVTVWAQTRLLPLLATMRLPIAWRPLHDGVVDAPFDVDVEIMELPWIFRTTVATIPATVPYLHVDPGDETGRDSLRRRPAIAVTWRAGAWDDTRSIPIAQIAPLARLDGGRWIGAVADPDAAERATWTGEWDESRTLLDHARLLAAMDLVISVDTMSAHLAGALGVPVWTLLKHDADWRWMEDRDDTPWYPSMRLLRQVRPGDWRRPILEAARMLSQRTCAERAC
jgi:hypothetical protein